MNPETNLATLIKGMRPQLNEGEYVFCSLPREKIPPSIQSICFFQEAEGVTLIVSKQEALRHNLSYSFVAAWITLNIYSSLEAVGFTAAISQALAKAGISCNAIAAYYHDHLFVPIEDAPRAMEILQAMTQT